MTTKIPPPQEPTGADLAGVAAELKAPRRSADGRGPQGFGAVLQGLITDRAWELPVAGGSAVDLWPAVAGSHATRAALSASARTAASSSSRRTPGAWLTQLRLGRPKLPRSCKEKLGPDVVRDIVQTSPAARPPGSWPAAPVIPVETALPGYRQARAAHWKTAPSPRRRPLRCSTSPARACASRSTTPALRRAR